MLLLLLPHLEPHSRFTWAGEAAASTSACRIARSIIFGDASSSSPRKYETSFDTPYPSVASRIRCPTLHPAIPPPPPRPPPTDPPWRAGRRRGPRRQGATPSPTGAVAQRATAPGWTPAPGP